MKTAEQILEGYVSCNCDAAYKDRGLRAPDCPLCSMHSCYLDAMKEYAIQVVDRIMEAEHQHNLYNGTSVNAVASEWINKVKQQIDEQ